ncbi:DUF6403 family protein [Amycolatopsis jejuensis]|uniref:DUF6403 family protein n=1 Tax=Amycolatopsis jejuensis TaxID=330084 RepID=UPI000524C93A|nr:DUF6403 family protein [Amycolatopsis jejuensis]
MTSSWPIWVLAALVLVAAGVAAVAIPRWRDRQLQVRTAWSAARAAVESATVSRDAAAARQPEAEQLLARAETLVASHGGTRAAKAALAQAQQADELWRAARG